MSGSSTTAARISCLEGNETSAGGLSSFENESFSCPGSLICLDSVCACPPGTGRDTVLWFAPEDSCGLIFGGIQGAYIVGIILSIIVGVLNFRVYRQTKPGPAHTTFMLCWLWIIFFVAMMIAHWAEGYQFGLVTIAALLLFQNLSTACLCFELYHVIAPILLLTRRVGATAKTRWFILIFIGSWWALNICVYIFAMCAYFYLMEYRNIIVLAIYDFFLIQFMVNLIFSYVSTKMLTSEIQSVRRDLLELPRIDHAGTSSVLQFYKRLGNVIILILVHIVFISIFSILLNVAFVYFPDYGWPFFALSLVTYPAVGLVPIIFWYSGGRHADEYAHELETTVNTVQSLQS